MLIRSVELKQLNDPIYWKPARPMRCMIIFPPSNRAVRAMYTFHNESEDSSQGVKPPLGPLFIATYMKQNSPHEVKVLDCQVLGLKDDDIRREIQAFKPDVLGVTAWSDFWYDAYRCIEIARETDPDMHITVGGPHVSIYPEVTLEHSGCDSVILGDAEVPFTWLANVLSHGEKPAGLPGLHFREHGVKQGLEQFYTHAELDTLPFPDRTLLPYEKYSSVLSKGSLVTTMITSRGCPHKCTFCKLSFQKTLSRSAEDVVNEMESIARLGIREIEVYDDTFTWSRQRLIDICKGILDRGLKLDWAIRDRVSNATPDTMEWLAKAGCSRIHFGVESGSPKTLLRIKKAITTDQAVNAVRLARKYNITVLTYFMLGLPGETLEDMRDTIRFAKKLDPDYTTFSVTVPYAGTEMYHEGLKLGIIPEDFWLAYAKKPVPNMVVPYFWEEHLGKSDLLRIRDEATRAFYFRPRYIARQLLQTNSWAEIARKGKMAAGLFQTTVLGKGSQVYKRFKEVRIPRTPTGFANNEANPLSVRV